MMPPPAHSPKLGAPVAEEGVAEPAAGSLPTLLTSGRSCAAKGPRKQRPGALSPALLSCPEDSNNEEDAYHQAFCVRNTFIDMAQLRSPSLERFYREREVHSCPSRQIGTLRNVFQECPPGAPPQGRSQGPAAELGLLQEEPRRPWQGAPGPAPPPVCPAPAELGQGFAASQWSLGPGGCWGGPVAAAGPALWWAPPPAGPAPPARGPVGPGAPQVLQLAAALPDAPAPGASHVGLPAQLAAPAPAPATPAPTQPATGTASGAVAAGLAAVALEDVPFTAALGDLPSVGSAGHAAGACKPCAFLHSKGCDNGAACTFCHLCGPGEKKRRQREKLALRRSSVQASGGQRARGKAGETA